jgi:hypothetical protein
MLRCGAALIGLLLPGIAQAQAPVSLHATYQTYAAGLELMDVETALTSTHADYQASLQVRTTGMVGFFLHGHQSSTVRGQWRGIEAIPSRFVGQGSWSGTDRLVDIAYDHGQPSVRQLVPPNEDEREPVPPSLQTNTIDTLSALMQLVRVVADTGRCDTTVRTYDGRRAIALEARTSGQETLPPTGRSSFAGQALRCDFSGRMLAGFRFAEDRARASQPMHGSAWLAPVTAGGEKLPVRITFQTRWFGDATMYLTAADTTPVE